MNRTLRIIGMIVVMGIIVTTQSGCLIAAAGAAAGGVAYVKGDMDAIVDGNVEQTFAATKAAFEELKMPLLSSWASGQEAKVEARHGTDNKVTVNIVGQTEKASKVSIRVGTFGDEALSQNILEKIKANLAKGTKVARGSEENRAVFARKTTAHFENVNSIGSSS